MNATKIVPDHALGQALQRILEQGKKPPCFRVNGLRITMASDASVNPGFLYVKNDNWDYIGKISTDGTMELRYSSRITDAQKTTLLDAIHHPLDVAMANGKETGICCCCGRTLTNKSSIELGIGPICRGGWFPDSTISVESEIELHDLETPLKSLQSPLETLESSDADLAVANLELDYITDNLGTPYSLKEIDIATVRELITIYNPLSDEQKNLFLSIIGDSNVNN